MGAVCGGSLRDDTPISGASLIDFVHKPAAADVETLNGLLQSACVIIHAAAVRRIEAQVVQSVLILLTQSQELIRGELERRWEDRCATLQSCCTLDIMTEMIVAAIDELVSIMTAHSTRVLSIIAEAELSALGASNAGSEAAKRSSNRSKCKLMIELNQEKNYQSLLTYIDYLVRRMKSDASAIVLRAIRPLPSLVDANESGSQGGVVSTAVPRNAFLDFSTGLVIDTMNLSALVDSSAFLQLTETYIRAVGEMRQSAKDDPPLSAKIHAMQTSRFTSTSISSSDFRRKNAEPFQAVVAQTPAALQMVFSAKERQLEFLIDQVHGVGGLSAMDVTLTSASGSQVIEFDSSTEFSFSFRSFSAATNETLFGRYCRVSPVVVVLLALQRQSAQGILEHVAETVTLVRQAAGWRDVTSDTMFSIVVPHSA